jgi:hypothetical protein
MHPQAWNPIPNPIARQIQPIEPKSGMNSIDYPLPPRRPDGCASRTRGRGRGKDKPDVMAGGRDPVGGSRGVWSPPPLSLAPPVAAIARQKKSPAHAAAETITNHASTASASGSAAYEYDSRCDWSGPVGCSSLVSVSVKVSYCNRFFQIGLSCS